ncbi:hypothetical protein KM043_012132 [Ampulex compressa]|nr:hypothetical protein KM043_012132 [Ampulex compressa]
MTKDGIEIRWPPTRLAYVRDIQAEDVIGGTCALISRGVGTDNEDDAALAGKDPTEIGNKVPGGSVNRFAPDSWPARLPRRAGRGDGNRSRNGLGLSRGEPRVGSRSNIKSYLAPLYPEVFSPPLPSSEPPSLFRSV